MSKEITTKEIPMKAVLVQPICPECGGDLEMDATMTLTTHPPQYRYDCKSCDYRTTSFDVYGIKFEPDTES